MPSEHYWRQAEANARIISWRNSCSAEWAKLADFYKEMAEKERAIDGDAKTR